MSKYYKLLYAKKLENLIEINKFLERHKLLKLTKEKIENLLDFYLFYFLKFIYFIYLFLSVLGLRCCVRAFSSCGEWGLLFIEVCELLIAVASLVVEHRL